MAVGLKQFIDEDGDQKFVVLFGGKAVMFHRLAKTRDAGYTRIHGFIFGQGGRWQDFPLKGCKEGVVSLQSGPVREVILTRRDGEKDFTPEVRGGWWPFRPPEGWEIEEVSKRIRRDPFARERQTLAELFRLSIV